MRFIGRQTRITTPILIIPPARMLSVRRKSEENPKELARNCKIISVAVKSRAAGSEIRKTCFKKPPERTVSCVSNVRMKLGIPIAAAPMRLSCIGING